LDGVFQPSNLQKCWKLASARGPTGLVSAQVYRTTVRDLNSTAKNPTERREARALIAELLGNRVRIRQEGEAVDARIEMNSAALLVAKVTLGMAQLGNRCL
jgi:hypothetical protein